MLHAPPRKMVKPSSPHYVIFGGGISGLSLAWYLQKQHGENLQITLIEKESRIGGYIHTIDQGNFLFEQGPRGCRTAGSGIDTLELIEELNLQDQVILADPSSQKKYRWIDQKLQPLPSGPLSLLFSPLLKDIASLILTDWKTGRYEGHEEESIHQFISRRCGLKIAETLFDPLTAGIYAGDIKKLSMKSCFPLLYQYEQQHGSLIKGMLKGSKNPKRTSTPFVEKIKSSARLFSLRHGMQQLTHSLASFFSGEILTATTPVKILFPDNPMDKITVHLHNQTALHADKVFSTIPSEALSSLLKEHDPLLSNLLQEERRASIAVINLGYQQHIHKWKGFGYLIPSNEKEKNLGVVWDSSVFPQQNRHNEETRLTVMVGGEQMHNFASYNTDDFKQIAIDSLSKQMKIFAKPDYIHVKIAYKAIPQYEVGHEERLETIKKRIAQLSPRFFLAGNWNSGVSVNDCIAYAKKMAI